MTDEIDLGPVRDYGVSVAEAADNLARNAAFIGTVITSAAAVPDCDTRPVV